MTPNRILYYRFKEFRLDVSEWTLLQGSIVIPLTHKAAQLLAILVERHGQVVQKNQIIELVWPGVHVTHANLTQHIYLLRKILGGGAIVTEPKRGYRFAIEVEEVYEEVPDVVDRQPHLHSPSSDGHGLEAVNDARQDSDSDEHARLEEPALSERGSFQHQALAIVLALVLLALPVILYRGLRKADVSPEFASQPGDSLAVLPFRTIGDAGGQDYFGLGMTDVIITKLSRLQHLNVRPTRAIFRYTDQPVDPVTAGRELGVKSVLDGSVQRTSGQIRVSVRLIRVSDGKLTWAEVFDEPIDNVFNVQDAIAERITHWLNLNPSEDERQLMTKRQTNSLEAYQAYVWGIYYCNKRTKEGLAKSIQYFTEAISKDQNYALAYAGLADSYALSAIWEFDLLPEKEAYERAKAAALKAVELDETLAEAHAALHLVRDTYERDWKEAEKEIRRAIELDPNNATIHHKYGNFLQVKLNLEGSYAELRLARQFDPLSMQINVNLCHVTFWLGRNDEAYGYCEEALKLGPDRPRTKLLMGLIDVERKRYDRAIELMEEAQAEVPPMLRCSLGYAYAKAGKESEARKVLASLEALEGQLPVSHHYARAVVYAGLGDVDQAFHHLKAEKQDWYPLCSLIKYDPQLAIIRSSSSFASLLKYCPGVPPFD